MDFVLNVNKAAQKSMLGSLLRTGCCGSYYL